MAGASGKTKEPESYGTLSLTELKGLAREKSIEIEGDDKKINYAAKVAMSDYGLLQEGRVTTHVNFYKELMLALGHKKPALMAHALDHGVDASGAIKVIIDRLLTKYAKDSGTSPVSTAAALQGQTSGQNQQLGNQHDLADTRYNIRSGGNLPNNDQAPPQVHAVPTSVQDVLMTDSPSDNCQHTQAGNYAVQQQQQQYQQQQQQQYQDGRPHNFTTPPSQAQAYA